MCSGYIKGSQLNFRTKNVAKLSSADYILFFFHSEIPYYMQQFIFSLDEFYANRVENHNTVSPHHRCKFHNSCADVRHESLTV